jgi:hypothetical protein
MAKEVIYLVILGLLILALVGDLVRYYKGQATYTKIFETAVPKVYRFLIMVGLLIMAWFCFGGLQAITPAICWIIVGHLLGI